MVATGTQIGVDGRRVPIDDLPELSADEFVEQQRLEMLRLTEALAEAGGGSMYRAAADILIPATSSDAAGASEAAWFAAIGPVPDFEVPVEADSGYAFEAVLATDSASDLSAVHFWIDMPVGASGRMIQVSANATGSHDTFHATSAAFWTTENWLSITGDEGDDLVTVTHLTGWMKTVDAGVLNLRMGQVFNGATTENVTLKVGSFLRVAS